MLIKKKKKGKKPIQQLANKSRHQALLIRSFKPNFISQSGKKDYIAKPT